MRPFTSQIASQLLSSVVDKQRVLKQGMIAIVVVVVVYVIEDTISESNVTAMVQFYPATKG